MWFNSGRAFKLPAWTRLIKLNYEILALINLRSLVRFIAPGLWPIAGLIPWVNGLNRPVDIRLDIWLHYWLIEMELRRSIPWPDYWIVRQDLGDMTSIIWLSRCWFTYTYFVSTCFYEVHVKKVMGNLKPLTRQWSRINSWSPLQ